MLSSACKLICLFTDTDCLNFHEVTGRICHLVDARMEQQFLFETKYAGAATNVIEHNERSFSEDDQKFGKFLVACKRCKNERKFTNMEASKKLDEEIKLSIFGPEFI